MRKVRFVPGVGSSRRIVDTSPKAKALDSVVIEKAFNARPVGSSDGLAHESVDPVAIDSGYPSEAAMDTLRKLPVPKLKKTTKSLF